MGKKIDDWRVAEYRKSFVEKTIDVEQFANFLVIFLFCSFA